MVLKMSTICRYSFKFSQQCRGVGAKFDKRSLRTTPSCWLAGHGQVGIHKRSWAFKVIVQMCEQ